MIATLYKPREDIKKKAKIADGKATIRDVVHPTLDGRKGCEQIVALAGHPQPHAPPVGRIRMLFD